MEEKTPVVTQRALKAPNLGILLLIGIENSSLMLLSTAFFRHINFNANFLKFTKNTKNSKNSCFLCANILFTKNKKQNLYFVTFLLNFKSAKQSYFAFFNLLASFFSLGVLVASFLTFFFESLLFAMIFYFNCLF
jgi:hypothetical protein